MKILVASSIDPNALAELDARHDVDKAFNAAPDELARRITDRQVLIFRSGVQITSDVLGAASDLRLIIRAGSGLDNIDLDHVRRHGLRLERVPGPGAQAVAELTFGLLLAVARRIVEADRTWRAGQWRKAELAGSLIGGKTLGVIGVGNIGRRVASLGAAWNMRVVGCVESPTETRVRQMAAAGITLLSCEQVLAEADFVTIHLPLNYETRGMIGAAALARMKAGAILVNIARGGIVDEAALRSELTAPDRLRGAGLDVHEHEEEGRVSPLADLPNVVLTPHIGAAAVDSQAEIGRDILNMVEALEQ
jgi:D-3-phosphoglycerate dehydrogenase / 2-oxoglutarate reductase